MEKKNKIGVIAVIIVSVLALAAVLVCLYMTAKQLDGIDAYVEPIVTNTVKKQNMTNTTNAADNNTVSNSIENLAGEGVE